jgi:hypothetical protein
MHCTRRKLCFYQLLYGDIQKNGTVKYNIFIPKKG